MRRKPLSSNAEHSDAFLSLSLADNHYITRYGFTGAPGHNAAREILRDFKRTRIARSDGRDGRAGNVIHAVSRGTGRTPPGGGWLIGIKKRVEIELPHAASERRTTTVKRRAGEFRFKSGTPGRTAVLVGN